MIRITLLILLLAAFVAAGLIVGPYMVGQKGYVLIALGHWTIEMTAISFGLFLLAMILAYLFLEWLIRLSFNLVSGSQQWLGGFSLRRNKKAFTAGLLAVEEGNYLEAKKQLSKIKGEDFSGLDLIAHARAEQALGNDEKTIQLLNKAKMFDASKVAASLKISEKLLAKDDVQGALNELESLDDKQQAHPQVIEQQARILSQSGRFQLLSSKLKDWKKQLPKEQYQKWLEASSKGAYAEIASKEGANELKAIWQQQPRKIRNEEASQAAYIQQLLAQAMYHDAEEALVSYQKKGPKPLLVELFRQIKLPNPAASIKLIEGWLKTDENNVQLLSVLGQLAYQAQDLDLAERALNKAIKLGNQRTDILLLAKIKEGNQDNSGALQLYKQCT